MKLSDLYNDNIDINDAPEELQIQYVNSPVGGKIKLIFNPSEAVQLSAINANPWAIGNIENPTEKAQLAAVTGNYNVIYKIKNPCEKVQIYIADIYPDALLGMDRVYPSVYKIALTNIDFIYNKEGYEHFVKREFKDNQILINKWLSYRKNMVMKN